MLAGVPRCALEALYDSDYRLSQTFWWGLRDERRSSVRILLALTSWVSLEEVYELLGSWSTSEPADFYALLARYRNSIDPEWRVYPGRTLLFQAAALGSIEGMQVLLELGAELDFASHRETVITASSHCQDSLRWLLAHGADPDLRNRYGQTGLIDAALHGNSQNVQFLLEAGASVDLTDSEGRTALWLACNRKRVRIVAMLLAAGADPDRRDNAGRTPLMQKINLEVARMLLAAGASPATVDGQGRSVLELAASRPELTALLTSAGASSPAYAYRPTDPTLASCRGPAPSWPRPG